MGMNKYLNKKTEVDGILFDSKKEALYYRKLKCSQDAGKIRDLQMQVSYELIPAVYRDVTVHLKTKDKIVRKQIQRPIIYKADFVYIDCSTGNTEVVDVKGIRTKEYILKKKMMLALKGIEIQEV